MQMLSQDHIRAALLAIELPDDCDCDCDSIPCDHFARADHRMTLEDWAQKLREAWPRKPGEVDPEGEDDYDDRPLDSLPSKVLDRECCIKVMATRYQNGLALWHPQDAWIKPPDFLARKAGKSRTVVVDYDRCAAETLLQGEVDLEAEKVCLRCKKSKPLYLFAPDSDSRSGKKCYCLKCERERTSRARYPRKRKPLTDV